MPIIIMLLALFCVLPVSADTIKLKDGEKVEGTIIENKDNHIMVEAEGRVRTIEWDKIKEIGRRVNASPAGNAAGAGQPEETLAETVLPEDAAQDKPEAQLTEEFEAARTEGREEAAITEEERKRYEALAAGFDPAGFSGLKWGRPPSDKPELKYVFTDPAGGINIYILTGSLPSGAESNWREVLQYYFRNDAFYKVHLPVKSETEWNGLKEQLKARYGRGYHLSGEKDIHQWDADKAAVVLSFDAASQNGYLEIEAVRPARKSNSGSAGGIQPLIADLADRDAQVRRRAVTGLGLMKDVRATMPLVRLLKDNDFIVRYNVAQALGEICDQRAVLPLMDALKDEDGFVRSFAAEALGKLGDERAVKALIDGIENNDSASSALEKLTGQSFGADPGKWREWWRQSRGLTGEKVEQVKN